MTQLSTQDENLRQIFKAGNRLVVSMWQAGLFVNPYPPAMGQIMVLVHTGRKSGLQRHTPVNYAIVDDAIYCTAGFGKASDWYQNVLAQPEVEVWLPGERWQCRAEDITDSPYYTWFMREVLKCSGFAAQLFGGLRPDAITEGELREKTQGYRLIRLQKVAQIPGRFEVVKYLPVAAGLLALGIAIRVVESRRKGDDKRN